MMLFTVKRRSIPSIRGSVTRQSLHMAVLMTLLVSILPFSTAKLFEAPSKYTGRIAVLLDVTFTLHLSAWKDGKLLTSKQLTDHDVDIVRLLETRSRHLFTLELVFLEPTGTESCALAYRFLRYDSPDIVGLFKEFYLTPAITFNGVDSSLEQIKFGEPDNRQENIGDSETSYLCNRTETFFFRKRSHKSDAYHYCVRLETRHIHMQAFGVRDGWFSPEPPTLCEHPTEYSDVAIVAGTATGSVLLLVLIAVVVVLLVRHKRQQPYTNADWGFN